MPYSLGYGLMFAHAGYLFWIYSHWILLDCIPTFELINNFFLWLQNTILHLFSFYELKTKCFVFTLLFNTFDYSLLFALTSILLDTDKFFLPGIFVIDYLAFLAKDDHFNYRFILIRNYSLYLLISYTLRYWFFIVPTIILRFRLACSQMIPLDF